MPSITILALLAFAAGIFFAFKIARKNRSSGIGKFIVSTSYAVNLGICLTFAAGVSHSMCQDVLKV